MKKTFIALIIAGFMACGSTYAGVRAGGISVARPSVSVSRPSVAPVNTFRSTPVPTPAPVVQRTVINRTVVQSSPNTGSGGSSSGSGNSFLKNVASSAVGSAIGAGVVNYAMKPSNSTATQQAPQAAQQIPSLRPSEVIIDCNQPTFKVLEICRGRSTQ